MAKTSFDIANSNPAVDNRLTHIHREQSLPSILWHTIQEDLLKFLEPAEGIQRKHIHSQETLLNLISNTDRNEIDFQPRIGRTCRETIWMSEDNRRINPKRTRVPANPALKELRGLSPDPKRRKEEQEHFLGGENLRRPSMN